MALACLSVIASAGLRLSAERNRGGAEERREKKKTAKRVNGDEIRSWLSLPLHLLHYLSGVLTGLCHMEICPFASLEEEARSHLSI